MKYLPATLCCEIDVYADKEEHFFLGGTFGPVYNRDALEAGHNWKDLLDV